MRLNKLSKINFIAIESELAPLHLENGDLDAAMFDSDYILASSFNNKYRTLMDFGADLFELYGTVSPAKFFVTRSDWYDKEPEIFHKVIDFFRANYKWSLEHIKEISKIESEKTGDNYEYLIASSKYSSRLDEITAKDITSYKYFYETAVELGVIKFIPDLNQLFIIKNK